MTSSQHFIFQFLFSFVQIYCYYSLIFFFSNLIYREKIFSSNIACNILTNDLYPVYIFINFSFSFRNAFFVLFILFSLEIDFDLKFFWAWTDFQSYLDFMLVIWFIGSIITYFMLPCQWFMESMGFIALLTEAMLGKHCGWMKNWNKIMTFCSNCLKL